MVKKTNSFKRPRRVSHLKINTTATKNMLPAFWFAREEPEHVRAILASYMTQLQIDSRRSINSREPKLFIGKIKRTPLQDTMLEDILTFDIINVYQRDLVPFANLFQVKNIIYCITRWTTDGMPTDVQTLATNESESMLEKLATANTSNRSYLYSLPDFGRKDEYNYFSSIQEQKVTFGDSYCRFLAGSECAKTQRFACKNDRVEHVTVEEYECEEEEEEQYTPIEQTKDSAPMYNDYLSSLSSPISPCGMPSFDDQFYTAQECDEDEDDSWGSDDDIEEEDSEDSDSDPEEGTEKTPQGQKQMAFRFKRQDTPVPNKTNWKESIFS